LAASFDMKGIGDVIWARTASNHSPQTGQTAAAWNFDIRYSRHHIMYNRASELGARRCTPHRLEARSLKRAVAGKVASRFLLLPFSSRGRGAPQHQHQCGLCLCSLQGRRTKKNLAPPEPPCPLGGVCVGDPICPCLLSQFGGHWSFFGDLRLFVGSDGLCLCRVLRGCFAGHDTRTNLGKQRAACGFSWLYVRLSAWLQAHPSPSLWR
jgi:hypothetical protein